MTILFPEYKIQRRIAKFAKRISNKHKKDSTPIVMLGILNGSFMFFTELVKNLEVDCEISFLKVKSYGKNEQRKKTKIIGNVDISLKGKHVYIVDDILETGITLEEVSCFLKKEEPKSISKIVMIKRTSCSYPVDYFCFKVKKKSWCCGYGLDDNNFKRNYRNIYILK